MLRSIFCNFIFYVKSVICVNGGTRREPYIKSGCYVLPISNFVPCQQPARHSCQLGFWVSGSEFWVLLPSLDPVSLPVPHSGLWYLCIHSNVPEKDSSCSILFQSCFACDRFKFQLCLASFCVLCASLNI